MTPLTLDSASAVGNVRRPTATDNSRENATGEGSASASTGNPARPSVVLNLNTSASQATLNGMTYANPRLNSVAREAEAQAETERQNLDRRNLQAAQATSTSRQAMASDRSA